MIWQQCRWVNEPAAWDLAGDGLRVTTDRATDFWRQTHYGFTRHSGHLFACPSRGAFTATLRVRAELNALYDQAGLMVLLDDERWVKAGVEISDGRAQLSSVLTLGQSDWAAGEFAGDAADFWIRATVDAGVLRLQSSVDGARWPLLRLCPFPAGPCLVGPMCCTPERAGLHVHFAEFTVTAPTVRVLHDLS